jgi:hypothetical protein
MITDDPSRSSFRRNLWRSLAVLPKSTLMLVVRLAFLWAILALLALSVIFAITNQWGQALGCAVGFMLLLSWRYYAFLNE